MVMKNDEEYSQQDIIQAIQQDMFLHQHQQMQQQLQQNGDVYGTSGRGLNNIFPSSEVLQPWPLPPAVHSLNPAHFISNQVQDDPFLVHYPTSSSYGSLFNRDSNRDPSLHFSYDGSASNQLRIISDSLGPDVHQPGSAVPFGLQHELGKMSAQEIMDAKALAASKSHSEAERRRRERINKHLAKLRSLLPNTTKTDKASLLAEVIEHVKELKRQTCLISETSSVPTETDELRVDEASDEEGRFFIKASICCEDRSDLLPDLIKTLKELRLTTVKAEITTIDGRVRNVLFITADEEDSSCSSYYNINNNIGDNHNQQQQQQQTQQYCISSIHEALKVVMEKTGSGDNDTSTSGNSKRQGTNNIDILGT